MDVAETDKEFEINVMLPGFEKDQIDVQFENHTLIISGERKWENEEKNGRRYHRVETGYGTFTRTLPLPDTADGDKISAEFRNGELFITIPKLKEKAGKKIKIS
jgi:HSP20 family protein